MISDSLTDDGDGTRRPEGRQTTPATTTAVRAKVCRVAATHDPFDPLHDRIQAGLLPWSRSPLPYHGRSALPQLRFGFTCDDLLVKGLARPGSYRSRPPNLSATRLKPCAAAGSPGSQRRRSAQLWALGPLRAAGRAAPRSREGLCALEGGCHPDLGARGIAPRDHEGRRFRHARLVSLLHGTADLGRERPASPAFSKPGCRAPGAERGRSRPRRPSRSRKADRPRDAPAGRKKMGPGPSRTPRHCFGPRL